MGRSLFRQQSKKEVPAQVESLPEACKKPQNSLFTERHGVSLRQG